MIRIDQLKVNVDNKTFDLKSIAAKKLGVDVSSITELGIIRRSVDARKKPVLFYIFSVWVRCTGEEKILKRSSKDRDISFYEKKEYCLPSPGEAELKHRPVVVGLGPAGLFCALKLAEAGFTPLVIERGRSVEKRKEDVEKFWQTGVLDKTSNVQFGEGGAGTFSDGKLTTSIKDKSGRVTEVLNVFVKHGAPDEIRYDHMPHLGTDVLPGIIKSIREKIIVLGGEVRFECKLTGIKTEDGKITGILAESGNKTEEIPCEVLVLATGHSSRDTYKMLFDAGLTMEQKPFACGFRVQHRQSLINRSQYGDERYAEILGAAPYKLTADFDGRGVFSFCMCPGGYVVNSSSEDGMTVVNGMSYSGRNSENANSAIVVSIPVSEYPSDHPLAGIDYQVNLEKKAFELGGGLIPVQRYGDFKAKVTGEKVSCDTEDPEEISPVFKGGFRTADLTEIFDEEINNLFVNGMTRFGRMIPGFDSPGCIMAGVESRTSSPVRIPRNDELMGSVEGIIPIGEGAGYAGGITSAAADGLKGAETIIRKFRPLQ